METFVVTGYFYSSYFLIFKFGNDSRGYEEATISRNRIVLDLDGAKKMVAGAAYIAMIDIMIFPEQKHGRAFFFQHILIERIVDCERLFFFFLQSLL